MTFWFFSFIKNPPFSPSVTQWGRGSPFRLLKNLPRVSIAYFWEIIKGLCPLCTPPFFSLRGACLTMRGGSGPLCTPRSKSSDLASAPIRGRSAPPTPGVYAGLTAPAPTCRRSARAWLCHARHPGDFPVAGKVTKGRARGVPLNPLRGTERKVFHFSLPLPLRQAAPPR